MSIYNIVFLSSNSCVYTCSGIDSLNIAMAVLPLQPEGILQMFKSTMSNATQLSVVETPCWESKTEML